ncbi:ATP-binding protein [Streptosporangium sp. DT93]|uniref:ATP-binding protein n=1 Tax=Streptosporangium sp. DT93 TaxID=3393428 RepID=UPI003CF207F6
MEQVQWWRGNLPAETNPLIGRRREVRRLLKLVADTPLTTVAGAEGVGKSRIAIRAAWERRDRHPDGVWLVRLSGERDGDLLADTVAAVLGLPERSARSQTEALAGFLADRRLLLVLDGCEHLLPDCRDLVAAITPAAPDVRIIVTSRRSLGLPGEALLPVEPFDVPGPAGLPGPAGPTTSRGPARRREPSGPEGSGPEGPEGLQGDDALRLFLDRARTAMPEAEPVGTEPIRTGPVGTEPVGTGPVGTGPVGTGPVGTGPVGRGPVGTESIGTEPAARICRLLGGVPLALELAAGGLRTLPPKRLADLVDERLRASSGDDGPALREQGVHDPAVHGRTAPDPAVRERDVHDPAVHDPAVQERAVQERAVQERAVRVALGVSHELCTPAERLLWARLSVFAGGFEPSDAEWVCGGEGLRDVAELLEHLAGRFLLERIPGGYRQPVAVREYGERRLALLGDEARTVRRHRYHYLDLARRAETAWYGPGQEEWAARLAFSMTDLRVALDETSPVRVELAGTLWILWFCLGRLNEGRRHMARAIETAPVTDPGLPRLLWADACVAIAQGELEQGRCRAEAALSAALDWGDHAAAGHAQLGLASRSLFAGALHEVEPLVERVRESFRRAGAATVSEPLALVTVAMAVTWRGEFDRAVSVLQEVQRLCDARGERWVRACGDYVLSIAQLGLGRLSEATQAARQSLDVKWRLRDATGVALAVDQLAVIAAVEGDGRRTARLQGAGVRLGVTFGLRAIGSEGMSEPRTVAQRTARQLLGDETYEALFAEGYGDEPDAAVAYALR